MDKYFRTQQGVKVDIVEHTWEQVEAHGKYLKIYIGTDAQDYGKITRFATCVCYRYGHRGAHFIYFWEEVPCIRDLYSRLYQEGERTVETAKLIIEEFPVQLEALEFDYNNIKKTKSTPVIQALSGWVKGLGLNASFKAGEQIATKAGDHVCRHHHMYPMK